MTHGTITSTAVSASVSDFARTTTLETEAEAIELYNTIKNGMGYTYAAYIEVMHYT